MSRQEELVRAVARAAARWQDPDYPPRGEAVAATLDLDNSFTEESVAFAINQQMSLLGDDGLRGWIAGRHAAMPLTVGVFVDVPVPFRELYDFLAVILTGHHYAGYLPPQSPHLLPAFAREIAEGVATLSADFRAATDLFAGCDVAVVLGDEEAREQAVAQCEAHGILPERRLIRKIRYAAAVLDGKESLGDLERLTEDVLLHDGHGCRRVAVVWAPNGTQPDVLLNALAEFRAVFPAGRALPGTLKMQQAFLQALQQPHAYGEGMEFLLSKGDPEPQPPGHVRWAEYGGMEEVEAWLRQCRDDLQFVAARPETGRHFTGILPVVDFGEAHRPPLGWRPDGVDTVEFLCRL